MLRGGAWNNQPDNAACAYRNNNEPDIRNNNIGFRCAKTPGARGKLQVARSLKNPDSFSQNLTAHGLAERGVMGVHSACPASCRKVGTNIKKPGSGW
ncbi:SUMF1/EgtB/PvdO family nonheme iron enzyme [candidate division KSB1 bacterium]|nr:SUMF1/EgtB/PvdO family nonheme iron enzyme [bacterium]NUM68941.1 SUMF1/EgtB/PvdO family nonheme iron enzyme [candidate division KSB1 bacterium]